MTRTLATSDQLAVYLLRQMEPRRAYAAREFMIPKNDAGIREAQGPLRKLKFYGLVDSTDTGRGFKLWHITNKGLQVQARLQDGVVS